MRNKRQSKISLWTLARTAMFWDFVLKKSSLTQLWQRQLSDSRLVADTGWSVFSWIVQRRYKVCRDSRPLKCSYISWRLHPVSESAMAATSIYSAAESPSVVRRSSYPASRRDNDDGRLLFWHFGVFINASRITDWGGRRMSLTSPCSDTFLRIFSKRRNATVNCLCVRLSVGPNVTSPYYIAITQVGLSGK